MVQAPAMFDGRLIAARTSSWAREWLGVDSDQRSAISTQQKSKLTADRPMADGFRIRVDREAQCSLPFF